MRWLERHPADYDRGMRLLTLGRLGAIHDELVRDYIRPQMRVLEIGCGTGRLAVKMAAAGAAVTAVDTSPDMLAVARERAKAPGADQSLTFERLDSSEVGARYRPGSFDLAVASMLLGELPREVQRTVLASAVSVLAPGGFLLVVDEALPESAANRALFRAIRVPLAVITWLATRTSARPLHDLLDLAEGAGCVAHELKSGLAGSIRLWAIAASKDRSRRVPIIPRLRARRTARTWLLEAWELVFRVVPPYPSIRPGLYAVGAPGDASPVLVTGNYDLTVRRLVGQLDGRVDAWLLVVDSSGINVWCAAGGGFLTADKVIAALEACGLDRLVEHRELVLPQLCANGVDGWRIRNNTDWGVRWGPVRAEDIPEYLASGGRKTESMRLVTFPLRDRLEMTSATLGLYGLLILVPLLAFWRRLFWPTAVTLIALSYFYAVTLPKLPGRDGLAKSVPLSLISLGGMLVFSALAEDFSAETLTIRAIGVVGLSVFVAAELQGMSPLMRGEQANWIWEAIVYAALLLMYVAVRMLLGWS